MVSPFVRRKSCASCGDASLKQFIDYGKIPLAGCFPKLEETASVQQYPFALLFCPTCKLVQANGTIDPNTLFKDYRYLSSVGLSKHFESLALYLKDYYALTSKHKILEIGSNDGVFLVPMEKLGLNTVGFEPSNNVSKIALQKGCNIINDFFSLENVKKHIQESSIDLIVTANCFAHIDRIDNVVKAMNYAIKPRGNAVIEVHYVKSLVEDLQYDFAYHEHIYYYSITSLKNLFEKNGMTVIDFEEIPVHSGSLRLHVCNDTVSLPKKIEDRIEEENKSVASWQCYETYARKVSHHKHKLLQLLNEIKNDGKRIVGYGASGRANVLCNYCDIGTNLVDYIVDESPERYDRYIPSRNIPIVRKEHFDNDPDIDYVLIFAWNFSKMIIEKLRDRDCNFIIPFPEPYVVTSAEELVGTETL